MPDVFAQSAATVRFDWGPTGAARLATGVSRLVVVDVLSFTTAVSVAVDAGTRVFPYPWRDGSAAAFAAEHGAELAVGRRAASADTPWTLSPAALQRAPAARRLVLPSPNGSAISAAVAGSGAEVAAGCLRNAAAVGEWAAGGDGPVGVVAAGERWPDGSLRPALEDLLGAGAVLRAVLAAGLGDPSPEASAAVAVYAATGDVPRAVQECASGRELAEGGFAADVAVAVEGDCSGTVPVLVDGAFAAAPPGSSG